MAFPTMDEISWKFAGKPYDLNSVLTPDQVWDKLDLSAEEVRTALNLIIEKLNTEGAANLNMTIIPAISASANTAQTIMEALSSRLTAITDGLSGADFIGVTTIAGVAGTKLQPFLEAFKIYVDAQDQELQDQITSNDSDITTLQGRATASENDIDILQVADGQSVKLAGDQTIAGVKTFSSSPIVPTPTTDMQPSTKKMMDDHKASTDHLATKIPYDSTGNTKIIGTTVQAAIDSAEEELKSIIGVNANAEVGSARVSIVKAKTFVDLDARIEESEQDLVTYKAETTAQLAIKAPQSALDTTNTNVTNLQSNKRDTSVPLQLVDLSTEVKAAMTGGAVAVVGTDSVGTENAKQEFLSYFKHFKDYPMLLKSKPKNLFNKNTVTIGYYVERLTGLLATDALRSASDYICVKPSFAYIKSNTEQFAYYDVNKVYISGLPNGTTGTFTTPSNTAYVRITCLNTSLGTLQFEEGITSTTYEAYVTDLLLDINSYFTQYSFLTAMKNNATVLDLFKAGLISKNIFDKSTVTAGFYVDRNTGLLAANALYSASEFIVVKPSTNYIKVNTDQLAFYDSNKSYISGSPNGTSGTFATPSNCVYARIGCVTTAVATLQLEEGTVATSYSPFGLKQVTKSQLAPDVLSTLPPVSIKSVMSQLVLSATTKKIKLIGDSRTHGVGGTGFAEDGSLIMTVGATSWHVNTSGHCWANSLRDFLQQKFNCTVTNYGCTGANSNQIVSGLSQLIDGTENIVICDIGTNDRHITTKQQYCDNLKAIYNYCNNLGIKVIFIGSFPAGLASETDVVNVYHMEDVDAIVSKATNDLSLEYISMYKLFNEYCQSREITIDSLLADTLHPNDTGYDVCFYLICNALGIATRRAGATWVN